MKLDDLDQKIIVALETDGRRPFREIARDLGIAEATVRARVNRLITDGLIHITAVGDPLKLGVNVMSVILIKVKPGTVKETAEKIARYSNVRFVGTSFGAADIIIQTLHPSIEALHRFVTEELPGAAAQIVSTETFQLVDRVKSSWHWQAWFDQQRELIEQ